MPTIGLWHSHMRSWMPGGFITLSNNDSIASAGVCRVPTLGYGYLGYLGKVPKEPKISKILKIPKLSKIPNISNIPLLIWRSPSIHLAIATTICRPFDRTAP